MNTVGKILCTPALALALASPTFAHHSAAQYNTQQEVTITGSVSQYSFKNPHIYIFVAVRNADGSTSQVEVEAGAASVLGPLGFTKTSVAVGDVVTIAGNPSRTSPGRSMLGKDLTKRDGTYYPLNIGSRSIYVEKNETATSIAGTWFSPRTEFNSINGAARGWPMTEKGRAAIASVDPKATTQKDCIPVGAPVLMFYPVANTITIQKDRIVMNIDWLDSERIIYMDGRSHPPASQTSLHGHSIGRWEGDTLVVDTTNFKEHAMGISMSLPGSTQKHLVERFRLSPDKKSLIYSGSVEDPVYLTKPAEWSGQWQYRPGMAHSNEKCDLDAARQFLKN